jgi:hypothetical protein
MLCAVTMQVSRHLKDFSRSVEGKQQLIIAAFAKALEFIPKQLAENAGFDSTDILNRLRQQHATEYVECSPLCRLVVLATLVRFRSSVLCAPRGVTH